MNINDIREDFPSINGKNIYFDNACQALKPRQVIEAVLKYYNEYPSCGERSVHKWGEIVTKKIEEARKEVFNFINASSEQEIIFTKNTTEAINIVARSFGYPDKNGALTTDKEHNSNFLPWRMLEKEKKIKHFILPDLENGEFDLERFGEIIKKENVGLVSLGFTSNIDGQNIPAKEIIEIAHKNNALVMLDAAQTPLHHEINVKKLDVDFLAFSGHKVFGPSGIGVLYGKFNLLKELKPFIVGGGTVNDVSPDGEPEFALPPEKFEAGLQNYAGIIGLKEAVAYIKKIGYKFITERERRLALKLRDALSEFPELKIINSRDGAPTTTMSFYGDRIDSHQICLLLDNTSNIMTRSGLFCNHYYFHQKNIPPAVRISLAFYNTEEEIGAFKEALKKVLKILS